MASGYMVLRMYVLRREEENEEVQRTDPQAQFSLCSGHLKCILHIWIHMEMVCLETAWGLNEQLVGSFGSRIKGIIFVLGFSKTQNQHFVPIISSSQALCGPEVR